MFSTKTLLIFGLVIGIAGALLDFYSGSYFLSRSITQTTMMGVATTRYSEIAEIWGIFALSLGLIVLITSLLNATPFSMGKMSIFGGLMIAYGIAMIVLGALMYSGVTPMMQEQTVTLASSLGMFVVGALMLLNGSLMIGNRAIVSPSQRFEM